MVIGRWGLEVKQPRRKVVMAVDTIFDPISTETILFSGEGT